MNKNQSETNICDEMRKMNGTSTNMFAFDFLKIRKRMDFRKVEGESSLGIYFG